MFRTIKELFAKESGAQNKPTGVNSNSILVLHPYKYYGTWVFDDDRTGLVREAFVSGIPEILEKCLEDNGVPVKEAENGFDLTFSKTPFPGAQVELTRLYEEFGGNWYESNEGMKGWLCPALFKYFPIAPEKIYARCERRK
jgi:hypothetical protein